MFWPEFKLVSGSDQTQPGISQMLFYDAPSPPPGIFDKFMDVPFFTRDVKTRDLLSLVKASPSNATANQRYVLLCQLSSLTVHSDD
jgi:hypothetical protein